MKTKILTPLFLFIPFMLLSQTISVNSTNANGPNTGSITATIVDPDEEFAPYQLIWTNSNDDEVASCILESADISNGQVSCVAINLNPGTYCLEATAFICDQVEPAEINRCFTISGSNCTNMLADYFPFELQDAICSSETIDQVVMVFSDVGECARNSIGEQSVNFEWSNGQTSAYPTELHPGEYCVTITPNDDVAPTCSSCFFVSCIEVPRLDKPIVVNSKTSDICFSSYVYKGLTINFRVSGWINVEATGGFGTFEITWLDGDNSGAYRSVSVPGTYCAQIKDECGNIDYECWDIEENISTGPCPVLYDPKGDILNLLATRNEITLNQGTFNSELEIGEDWELRLEESSFDFAKYSISHKDEAKEFGKIDIIGQIEKAEEKDNGTPSNTTYSNLTTSVKVFPNPAFDIVNIQIISENSESDVLQMFNISGKLMFERPINLTEGEITYSINVEKFPSGVYFLKTQLSTPTKLIITKN